MKRQTKLFAFAVQLKGSPEMVDIGRQWCKVPERTENWKRLQYMLHNWEEVNAIQYRNVTPRF